MLKLLSPLPGRDTRTGAHDWRHATALAASALVLALAAVPVAKASSHFDGDWKVTIITEAGTCDPVYSYPIRITGGRVTYTGTTQFQISGNVADAGAVQVDLALGEQRASATGRLTGKAGAGKWSGKSATATCSGRWEAALGG